MNNKISKRKIVVVNQAVNYLTVDICNAFSEKFENVALITGNVHEQGTFLDSQVKIAKIKKYDRSSSFKKSLSYLSANLKIWYLLMTRCRHYEVFFISLPPMAYLLTLFVGNKCSVLIWDVYPDVLKINGVSEKNIFYRIWSAGNRKVFRKAYRLFTIGEKMAGLLSKYVSKEKIIITPLWSIFDGGENPGKENNPFVIQENIQNKFIIQYSGNIGFTHNVELMILLAEKLKHNKNIQFQIIGKGFRMPLLRQMVKEKQLKNCTILPFQSDDMFPFSLSAADVGVVILENLTAKGSVPSKTYNLMSFGKPILYLVSEESELFQYSKIYKNGKAFDADHLDNAAFFIEELASNKVLYEELSLNSSFAAKNFTRENARKIVTYYLNE